MTDPAGQRRTEPAAPPPAEADPSRRGLFSAFLSTVEWLGNLLPHPVTLFACFALLVVLASGLAGWFELAVEDPRPVGAAGRSDDGMIRVVSLMNADGFRRIMQNLVSNFVGFVPLGTVLVALLGVGVAERSGLLSAAMRWIVLGAPRWLVTAALVFAAVVSNTASEMGYVVIVPLGAAIFHSLGRHPLAGLAAAFAGVSGGYSANLLIGTVDPLLAGITQEAARIYDPGYEVHPAVNWYFMIISTGLITVLGTWVTVRIVEPKLGAYDPGMGSDDLGSGDEMRPLTPAERRALGRAGLAAAAMGLGIGYLAGPHFTQPTPYPPGTTLDDVRQMDAAERQQARRQAVRLADQSDDPRTATVTLHQPRHAGLRGAVNRLLLAIPGYGVLRNPETGDLLSSPLLRSVVSLIFLFFIVPGYVYGRGVGSMRTDRDIIEAMAGAMSSLGLYIVLVFFAAQFVTFFNWTNFGSIIAVLGSDLIIAMKLDNALVFIPFILMCCGVNLMLGSASAQWAVTAPIFVPMLMRVGYSPEVIQAAYRIGDSTTNVITPMMSYFGIIFALATRYQRNAGLGTMISMMLPYTLVFLGGWIILFYLWVFVLGLPVGPGAATHYAPM